MMISGYFARRATPSPFANDDLTTLLVAIQKMSVQANLDVTAYDTYFDSIEGGFDVCFAADWQELHRLRC
jgi:hypothetical protein